MDKTLHPFLQQKHWEIKKKNIPASFGSKKRIFSKSKKTKVTAVTRSIDFNNCWTIFYKEINKTKGFAKIGFSSSNLISSLYKAFFL